MPVTHYIDILIDQSVCEIGRPEDLGLRYSYSLEDPESFDQKQGGISLGVLLPATPTNDKIFNTFHDPNVTDMSGSDAYTNYRSCQIIVNGVNLLNGCALLKNASHTRLPEDYNIDCFNQNGSWIIDGRDLTVWDCLNTTSHQFTVENVEASWTGFDSDEFHDYVYAPVRYRTPFGINDDAVTIYHLRPSISVYWLLVRGFRQLGYGINSVFLNTVHYFRRLVIPWTHGDFYDINGQLTDGLSFEAAGLQTTEAAPSGSTSTRFWTGSSSGAGVGSAGGSSWNATVFSTIGRVSGGLDSMGVIQPTGGKYVVTSGLEHFRLSNTLPPNGHDNFGLYSFDDTTGTMQWIYNPPAAIAPFYGNNITANFQLSLMLIIQNTTFAQALLALEITHIFAGGGPTVVTTTSIMPAGGFVTGNYPTAGSGPGLIVTPTVYNFSVPNINQGDTIKFRFRALQNGGLGTSFNIYQAGFINANPSSTGANTWQYNTQTEQWANIDANVVNNIWQPTYSFLQMTGLQLQVGGPVHFQWYDKFRSYKWLDLLRGIVDAYDLSIQTDPINRMVTIEPTNDYVLPDGTKMKGYFVDQRLDWTAKQDISKKNVMNLFSEFERQFDFSFKGDGSDGGLNIFAARYKGAYLNNKIATTFNNLNNSNNDNGIISAIPGASRFMFPPRFQKGTRALVNRFFSATMHYKHSKWADIAVIEAGAPSPIAPQLICIIPENVSDSSANSIGQTFEPKLAFYSGQQPITGVGGWRWQGDPIGRGYDAAGQGIPTYNSPSDVITDSAGTQPLSTYTSIGFQLPYMFAVDYSGYVAASGSMAPVLTYSDQNINGTIQAGLMKTFYLRRLATIREGKQYRPWIRLNLGDITDWEHRNKIIINNAIFKLIGIDGFDPLSDKSTQCTLWKEENPNQSDLNNCFPSATSILASPTILPQFDLKSAQLLLFITDLPQTA